MLSCSHGQDCEVDKQGIANCVCSQTCEPIVRPVCANNGNTFDNLCEMELNGCQDRLPLVAKYFGTCGKWIFFIYNNSSQWARKFKKVQAKKIVNNQINHFFPL